MKIELGKIYKRKEIKHLLKNCPFCSSNPSAYWEEASIKGKDKNKGSEGFVCDDCKFFIMFLFRVSDVGEIIDEYAIDTVKINQYEYKMSNDILRLYCNNTYVKQISNKIIDLDECKKLLLLM